MGIIRRIFLKKNTDKQLDLNQQELRVDKSQLRWSRIGVAATVLLGLPGTLAVLGTRDDAGPKNEPIELTLSGRLEKLRAGIAEEKFVTSLGQPLRSRDLSADFELLPGQKVWESVWLVGDRQAWVQTLADEDRTVWYFSVVSCDNRVTPTYRATTTGGKITLLRTSLSEAGAGRDVFIDYFAGASWPGQMMEAAQGGDGASSFREAVWGRYPACRDGEEYPFGDLDENTRQVAIQKGIYGYVSAAQSEVPSLAESRRRLTPNFFGEFATYNKPYDGPSGFGLNRGIPSLKENGIPLVDDDTWGPYFLMIGPYVGPEPYLIQNLMAE